MKEAKLYRNIRLQKLKKGLAIVCTESVRLVCVANKKREYTLNYAPFFVGFMFNQLMRWKYYLLASR